MEQGFTQRVIQEVEPYPALFQITLYADKYYRENYEVKADHEACHSFVIFYETDTNEG